MILPSYEELKEIVKKLQEIMRIQDWDIELRLCTGQQMLEETDDIENIGFAFRNVRHKYALIRLNTEHPEYAADWYITLIHELKHVQTTEFKYVFDKFLCKIDVHVALKEAFEEQTKDYYEQWMNVCAREFARLYPADNFFKKVY